MGKIEFYSKEQLEEFLGYSLDVVKNVEYSEDRRGYYVFDKHELAELVSRVREIAYKDGQNNILENQIYC